MVWHIFSVDVILISALYGNFVDFTPSRGSTPIHHAAGTPRLSRVFSPQVSRAVFEGKPPIRSGKHEKITLFASHTRIYCTCYVIAFFRTVI